MVIETCTKYLGPSCLPSCLCSCSLVAAQPWPRATSERKEARSKAHVLHLEIQGTKNRPQAACVNGFSNASQVCPRTLCSRTSGTQNPYPYSILGQSILHWRLATAAALRRCVLGFWPVGIEEGQRAVALPFPFLSSVRRR